MIANHHNRQDAPCHRFRQNLLGSVVGILLACAMTACGQKNAQVSAHEATGSKEECVAETMNLLGKSAPLPGPLLDAHFVEEKTGDGRLGPSDFKTFYALTVAPAELPTWKAALSKSKPANTFSNGDEIKSAAPKNAQPWWVSGADVGKLEIFQSAFPHWERQRLGRDRSGRKNFHLRVHHVTSCGIDRCETSTPHPSRSCARLC